MKKSEMVEKMRGHFRGAQNLGSETAIFNYILDRMIEAGMLPPDSYPSFMSLGEYPTNQAISTKKRWKWEDEDEEE